MSERLQRYLLWFLAIGLVVGTGLALRYARGYRPVAGFSLGGPSMLPGDVALQFDNVRVVGWRDHQKTWTLTAGRVGTTRARSRVDFSGGVKAVLLDQGKPRATFSVPQATFDVGAKLLVAAGQVSCIVQPAAAEKGREAAPLRVEAHQVIWNVGSRMVSCPGSVTANLPGLSVSGENLAVDLRTRSHSMKQFRAHLTLNDDGEPALPAAAHTLQGLIP